MSKNKISTRMYMYIYTRDKILKNCLGIFATTLDIVCTMDKA